MRVGGGRDSELEQLEGKSWEEDERDAGEGGGDTVRAHRPYPH